jgi:hypothetical protein
MAAKNFVGLGTTLRHSVIITETGFSDARRFADVKSIG